MNDMTIGRAANAAGVKIDTIRYYQRIGLIAEPLLPQGGQRKYGEAVVRRVKFIKRAQTTRASPQKSNAFPTVMHRAAMDHGMHF